MPGDYALPRIDAPAVTWFPGVWVMARGRINTPNAILVSIVTTTGSIYGMFQNDMWTTVVDAEWDHNAKVMWAFGTAGYFPSLTGGFEGVANLNSPVNLPDPLQRFIAFQWGGDYMYVLADLNSPSDHRVWMLRYDRVTGAYVDQVQVVNYANRFEWDRGRYVWVLGGASIQLVDIFLMTVESTWNTGNLVLDIAYTGPIHGMMAVLVQNPGTGDCFVWAVDPEGTVQGTWGVDRYAYALCTDMDHRIFIVESKGWRIQRVDLDNAILTTVEVYDSPRSDIALGDPSKGIAYDRRGGQVWMATKYTDTILAIDPATLATNRSVVLTLTTANEIIGMSWVGGSDDAGAP